MASKSTTLIFVATVFAQCLTATKVNVRPTLGILSQQVQTKYAPNVTDSEVYIAASYVKYLEMAGARVVPILSTYPKTKILYLMHALNGVLFPGGSASYDSGYTKTARIIFKEAIRLNNKGVSFPLWGTCLGFETLHNLAAGKKVLVTVDAENLSMELNLTQLAFKSRLFDEMDKKLLTSLMFNKIAMNNHNSGVSTSVYAKNKKVNEMYKVLSTNVGRNGVEFVSTIEGIKYPFYGTQWHPEKNIFEWTSKEGINHSPDAVRIAQYLANFFVNEARKNLQTFPSDQEEMDHSIYKYAPVFSGSRATFEQVYVFGNETEHIQQ